MSGGSVLPFDSLDPITMQYGTLVAICRYEDAILVHRAGSLDTLSL